MGSWPESWPWPGPSWRVAAVGMRPRGSISCEGPVVSRSRCTCREVRDPAAPLAARLFGGAYRVWRCLVRGRVEPDEVLDALRRQVAIGDGHPTEAGLVCSHLVPRKLRFGEWEVV